MADQPADEQPTPTPPRKRRVRYRGTHPRRFGEKYKELDPDKHPDVVAHVRASGKTPAGTHVPIMVEEVLEALAPRVGERGVDATLGWGGHAQRLLEQLAPDGCLLALDADPIELPKSEARLRRLGFDESVLLVRRTNFAGLCVALDEVGWMEGGDDARDGGADFVFADLGVSSMQIDDPARGFSVKADGPLDMRMNPKRGLSAAQWLETASVEAIEAALVESADEPHAALLARALDAKRGTLATTCALSKTLRAALGPRLPEADADASVRRVFQALRIAVNDEFGALDALLRQLPDCVRPSGRVAILSFHSGEDRRVKKAFQQGVRDGVYASTSDDVIRPSAAEQRANPRSAPAKLRWARRAP
jgi:16S rRNA (cytosine1402-N4)-methyltransferase